MECCKNQHSITPLLDRSALHRYQLSTPRLYQLLLIALGDGLKDGIGNSFHAFVARMACDAIVLEGPF
jgi:hypothetical protein